MYSDGPPHMAEQKQEDQHKLDWNNNDNWKHSCNCKIKNKCPLGNKFKLEEPHMQDTAGEAETSS